MNCITFALAAGLTQFNVIDLTHTIDENTKIWDGSCGYSVELTSDYAQGGFRGQKFAMRSCLGTHLDTPAHCFENALDCSSVNISNFIAPAYVINISSKAYDDYEISDEDIKEFENQYETIQANSLVIFATGWSKHWNTEYFRNEKSDGKTHFPHVSEAAIRLLLARNVAGIGIDTLSPDSLHANPIAHTLLLGNGKYIIESIASLENMPAVGSYVIALPLKIKGGVESPIRLVGLVPLP